MAAPMLQKKFLNIVKSAQNLVFRRLSQNMQNVDKRFVLVEKMGKISLIGLNRPEKRNAVNHETAKQLAAAFRSFEEDDSVSVGVLYGKGGNFCAGYDLSELSEIEPTDLASKMEELGANYGLMGSPRQFLKKPVIAALEGYAVAGGLELSLLCDMRIADETAILGVFCRRFGVPLIDGGTVRLPRLIGLSRAMELILLGRPVSAKDAHQYGLVSQVVQTGTALGCAIQLAHSISRYPQECMRADRESAYHAMYDATSMKDALEYEFRNGLKIVSKESIEGAKKFAEGEGRHGDFSKSKL